MGLLDNPVAMGQLFDHLREFEGNVGHFYYDSKNLITIAIGELVDQKDAVLAVRRARVEDFAPRWHARFVRRGGGGVSAADVLADWDRIAALTVGHRSRADCEAKSQCSIPNPTDREAIARRKVRLFYNALVRHPREHMADYHPGIQMAFVDTLYNPGLSLFGMSGDRGSMWHALDPHDALYNPQHARELFARIWRAVEPDKERYQRRVTWRLARFDEGLRATARP